MTLAAKDTPYGTMEVPIGLGEIPDQTGASGKFLTTDGQTPSWGTVSAGPVAYFSQGTNAGDNVSCGSSPTDLTNIPAISVAAVAGDRLWITYNTVAQAVAPSLGRHNNLFVSIAGVSKQDILATSDGANGEFQFAFMREYVVQSGDIVSGHVTVQAQGSCDTTGGNSLIINDGNNWVPVMCIINYGQ